MPLLESFNDLIGKRGGGSLRRSADETSSALILIIAIGGVIAAANPFDVAFARLTFGSPTLRVGLFAFLAISGALFAARADLKLQFHGTPHPILVGLAAALFVALIIALIDGVLFRKFLPAPYVEYYRSTPLDQRLTYFMLRAQ
jgi:hypothetical protein